MTTHALRIAAIAIVLGGVAACDAPPPPPPDGLDGGLARGFGETCRVTEDCASALCIGIVADVAICTRACDTDADCPAGPSWGCVEPEGLDGRVCGCEPSAPEEICGDGEDNDCNGRADDCRLCGGVPVPTDDPRHCGACGRACRADQECSDGTCRCPPGLLECGGECVDPAFSSDHCGACGQTCPSGGACVDGACACPPGLEGVCDGACVSLETNAAHCGACDLACLDGTACVGGECECTVAGRPDHCPGIGCVDLATDESSCGVCGERCTGTQQCVDGHCQCDRREQRLCGTSCVDLAIDPANCGACGAACDPGARCSGGRCVCDSGVVCGGTCAPVGDPRNCGACGVSCRSDQRCDLDRGGCACASGVECGGRCVDTRSDRTNCGGCGVTCASGQTCSSGACRCTSGTDCPGLGCVDTSTDERACGSCVASCRAGEECVGGACRCPASQVWCSSAGRCIDTRVDVAHCGTCDRACPSAMTCSYGTCACPGSGQSYCPSVDACVSLSTDPMHCGACDRACPAGTTCEYGSCRCATAGQTVCGDRCVDLQSDETACGGCANVCAAGRTCTAGTCWCPDPIVAAPVRITSTIAPSTSPRIATNGTRIAVVWREDGTTGDEVRFVLLEADGTRAMTSDLIVAPAARAMAQPDVVWSGTEWGVAWLEDSGSGLYRAYFRRIAADGTPAASTTAISQTWPGNPYLDSVAIAHNAVNGYAVAALTSSTAWLQILGDGTGTMPHVVPFYWSYLRSNVVELAGASDGGYAIQAYSIEGGTFIQPIAADGSIVSTAFRPTTSGTGHDIVWDGDTWLMSAATGSTTYRPVALRGPTLASALQVRPSAAGTMAGALSVRGDDGVVVTAVYPDTTSASPGTLEVTRIGIPTGSTSAPPIVRTPSRSLGVGSTVVRGVPVEVAMVSETRFVVVWADTRWGQLELYAAAADVAACD